MDIYGTKQIRNVVLLGHGGAGKTTVAEALAYLTGVTKRMGKVADGNTISDYDKEEIKRQFSITTTMVPIEYEGAEGKIKINLLDTPGYFDFVGEVEEAVSAADAAIIVVNCKAGIEVGTEKAWDLCEEYKLPRIIFVTNMDDDHASFRELILKLEKKFGRKIAPFQVPIRENEKFVGFVNAVKMQGRRFTNLSDYEDCEIPEYTKKNLGIIRDALIEAVAETSEEYMERYFSGEEFTQDEIYTAVQTHVCDGSIVPVMMGSGINCQGFNALLNAIDRYFPSPDKGECVGVDVSNGEHFTAKYNDEVSLSARVFKTIVDPFIGKYSLMKVCTGTLKPDSTLYNVNKDTEEKIAKVYVLRGKDVIEVPELKAGDIDDFIHIRHPSSHDGQGPQTVDHQTGGDLPVRQQTADDLGVTGADHIRRRNHESSFRPRYGCLKALSHSSGTIHQYVVVIPGKAAAEQPHILRRAQLFQTHRRRRNKDAGTNRGRIDGANRLTIA